MVNIIYTVDELLSLRTKIDTSSLEKTVLEKFQCIEAGILKGTKQSLPAAPKARRLSWQGKNKFAPGNIMYLSEKFKDTVVVNAIMSKEKLPSRAFGHPVIITSQPWDQYGEIVINVAICSSNPVERDHSFPLVNAATAAPPNQSSADNISVEGFAAFAKKTYVQTRCIYTVPLMILQSWARQDVCLSSEGLESLIRKINEGETNRKSFATKGPWSNSKLRNLSPQSTEKAPVRSFMRDCPTNLVSWRHLVSAMTPVA